MRNPPAESGRLLIRGACAQADQGDAWDAHIQDDNDVLSTVPLFQGLRKNEKAALRAALKRRVFRHGERIVTQGDVGREFFLIEDGLCEVSVARGEDDVEVISLLESGDHFGETALLPGRSKPRTSSVIAMTSVDCLTLTADTFDAVTKAAVSSGTVHVGGIVGVSGRKRKDETALMRRFAEFGPIATAVIRYRDGDEGSSWALVAFESEDSVRRLMAAAGERGADGVETAKLESCFEGELIVRSVDVAKAMASDGVLPEVFQECRDRIEIS